MPPVAVSYSIEKFRKAEDIRIYQKSLNSCGLRFPSRRNAQLKEVPRIKKGGEMVLMQETDVPTGVTDQKLP
jgi:hypothetical protein